MINLVPPVYKAEIIYSRKNKKILNWVVSMVFVIVAVVGLAIFGQFYINKNVNNLQKVAGITKERISSQDLESTQKEMEQLSSNFKTIIQLLSKQLLFSKILDKTGSIMPTGTALSGITIATNDSSIDLQVLGVDKNSTTQAFINISDPKNGLFDKADLVSITCSTQNSIANFPCQAQIKATIKNDSSFYFINSLGGVKK
jgi:hypothetical protein